MKPKEYDHNPVRCEIMEDADCDFKYVGEPATCCVCIGHDCKEAREEIARRDSTEIRKTGVVQH